jgi:hypothetical protein
MRVRRQRRDDTPLHHLRAHLRHEPAALAAFTRSLCKVLDAHEFAWDGATVRGSDIMMFLNEGRSISTTPRGTHITRVSTASPLAGFGHPSLAASPAAGLGKGAVAPAAGQPAQTQAAQRL